MDTRTHFNTFLVCVCKSQRVHPIDYAPNAVAAICFSEKVRSGVACAQDNRNTLPNSVYLKLAVSKQNNDTVCACVYALENVNLSVGRAYVNYIFVAETKKNRHTHTSSSSG